MLVFRRQQGESFRIGDEVEVRVLKVARGYVKIGVIAPRSVGVFRTELADLNRKALLTDLSPVSRKLLTEVAGQIGSAARPDKDG